MKNKLISLILCTAMALAALTGCGLSGSPATSSGDSEAEASAEEAEAPAAEADASAETAPAADAVTLTMAEVNPLDSTICGAMDLKFKEKVEELSGGSIVIDLQGGGVLESFSFCEKVLTLTLRHGL